jgi:catechol 2,3-dioxygenase-like lactoylglutathione lyase family enzyme
MTPSTTSSATLPHPPDRPAIYGVTLGAHDLEASAEFYAKALAPLGIVRLASFEREIGFGREGGQPAVWIVLPYDGLPATWGNGTHVAFLARSQDAVEAFHAAGLAAGAIDAGAPGLRPQYGSGYYGAYLRDPVGTKIQAVHYGAGSPEAAEAANAPWAGLFSHVTVGTGDLERACRFYDRALAPLGLMRVHDQDDERIGTAACWGWPETLVSWIFAHTPFDGRPAAWANGFQISLKAADRASVQAFHAAGLAAGGHDEGAPGERAYRPGYYGAYLRDPDGNKLHAFWEPDGA